MNDNSPGSVNGAKGAWAAKASSLGERRVRFTTVSGEPIAPLYTPDDTAGIDFLADVGFPGEYPYTRGIHHTMYRGRLWTMR
jgi:methylmalonyl-CoA mutase N-terminal domain/subunit